MKTSIETSLAKLLAWCEVNKYKGYDPYDTLNSPFNFKVFGKWGPPVAIQIQKRNPLNIRSLLGVKKGINPKAMGLFLKAYSLLYRKTDDQRYLEKADYIFNWLSENYSQGYSGKCWGYNFDWASPGSYLPAFTPSVVVTSFVCDGIFEYYKVSSNPVAKKVLLSAAEYIRKDIQVIRFETGLSFAYTHLKKDACYNSSLLAAEILAKAYHIKPCHSDLELIKNAVRFVLSKQKEDGHWKYSIDPVLLTERNQIDFHQGFIIVSLKNIMDMTGLLKSEIHNSIEKGLHFYKTKQFFPNGRSFWRLPRKWPVDIHNQSQGIITFSMLNDFNPSYIQFANSIASWTIDNMQASKGYFYYRLTPLFTNKIPFIRWSQAWMLLALAQLTTINAK